MELQSGFVLAAIIAAVLFATKIGGSDDLARRMLQVALGISIALATVSATTAFVRPPEPPEESSDDGGFGSDEDEQYEFIEDLADHGAAVSTVHAGVGLLGVLIGLVWLSRVPVTSLGVVLGGLLLLIFGGRAANVEVDASSVFFASYGSLLGSFFRASSRWLDIAHFLVMLGGTLALLLFSYLRFDEGRLTGEAPATEPIVPE